MSSTGQSSSHQPQLRRKIYKMTTNIDQVKTNEDSLLDLMISFEYVFHIG